VQCGPVPDAGVAGERAYRVDRHELNLHVVDVWCVLGCAHGLDGATGPHAGDLECARRRGAPPGRVTQNALRPRLPVRVVAGPWGRGSGVAQPVVGQAVRGVRADLLGGELAERGGQRVVRVAAVDDPLAALLQALEVPVEAEVRLAGLLFQFQHPVKLGVRLGERDGQHGAGNVGNALARHGLAAQALVPVIGAAEEVVGGLAVLGGELLDGVAGQEDFAGHLADFLGGHEGGDGGGGLGVHLGVSRRLVLLLVPTLHNVWKVGQVWVVWRGAHTAAGAKKPPPPAATGVFRGGSATTLYAPATAPAHTRPARPAPARAARWPCRTAGLGTAAPGGADRRAGRPRRH